MKKLFYAPIFTIILILSACATMGLPTAQTFEERLAVSYATVETARESATVLLQAKKITKSDAQNVLEQTDNARSGINIARAIGKTDLTAADAKLNAVRAALVALQAYLGAKEQK